jgi:uncharacterized repeat protein (TIGR03803 family)
LVSDGVDFLWGTTNRGGANGNGTIFKVSASTGLLTTILDFDRNGTKNRGAHPRGKMISDGAGNFWGTTREGGTFDNGTVFKVNEATGVLTTVIEFEENGTNNKGIPAARGSDSR